MIYLLMAILLVILSLRYDVNGKTENRDFWFHVVLVVFILVSGFRYRLGIDTVNYLNSFYHKYPYIWNINKNYLLASSSEPLWLFLNSIVRSLGGKFFVVQLIQSSIVNIIVFRYFKKHSDYLFICILFYFTSMYFLWNFIVMRSAVSMAICLVGNDYILERKWKKGYLTYLLAFLFHFSAVVVFITPFLLFLRLNRKGVLILIFMFVLGFFIERILGDYLMMFELSDDLSGLSNKMEHYSSYLESERFSGGRNIFKILPSLIYGLLSLWCVKRYGKQSEILKLEPFLMIGLIYTVLQFGFTMSYRFARFYEIYLIIIEVQYFAHLLCNQRLSRAFSYCRTILVFSPLFASVLFSSIYVRYHWYVPYSSVFNRKVDNKREKSYDKQTVKPIVVLNEY